MNKSFHRCVLIVLPVIVGMFAQSCAAPAPIKMTCSEMGMSVVVDSSKRLHGRGFSVLPPSEGRWCVRKIGQSAIGFNTNSYLGTYISTMPDVEKFSHTFAVVSVALDVKETDISSGDALKGFVETWLSRGANVQGSAENPYIDLTPAPRFKAIEQQVKMKESTRTDCVTYHAEVEERNNSTMPNWVLKLTNEGFACRHPDSKRLLIRVEFSERRRKGYEDPGLRREVRKWSESTIQSLELTSL